MTDQPNEVARMADAIQTLRAALDLKEKGGLSEEDYTDLKRKLLVSSAVTASLPETKSLYEKNDIGAMSQKAALVALYSGNLHRMMGLWTKASSKFRGGISVRVGSWLRLASATRSGAN